MDKNRENISTKPDNNNHAKTFFKRMKALVCSIYEAMQHISLIFEGNIGKDNPEVIEMKKDVLYRPLPNASTDRGNLKNDGTNAVQDLNKALDEYKKEQKTLAV